MFVILMTTIIGAQATQTQFTMRYRTLAECNAAIVTVAHQQVPALNSMIAFRCVKEERGV